MKRRLTIQMKVTLWFTLLMVLLLVGSAMMISLGIIGYYISKIYEEVKRRPRYIISKVIKNGNIQD